MNKIWFFFNTAQLIASFPMIDSLKLPANVIMLQKAYEKIVMLQIFPENFWENIQAKLGLGSFADSEASIHEKYRNVTQPRNKTEDNSTDSAKPTGKRVLLVQRVPKNIQIRNQYLFVGFVGFLAIAGGLLYYFRMKIWN